MKNAGYIVYSAERPFTFIAKSIALWQLLFGFPNRIKKFFSWLSRHELVRRQARPQCSCRFPRRDCEEKIESLLQNEIGSDDSNRARMIFTLVRQRGRMQLDCYIAGPGGASVVRFPAEGVLKTSASPCPRPGPPRMEPRGQFETITEPGSHPGRKDSLSAASMRSLRPPFSPRSSDLGATAFGVSLVRSPSRRRGF